MKIIIDKHGNADVILVKADRERIDHVLGLLHGLATHANDELRTAAKEASDELAKVKLLLTS